MKYESTILKRLIDTYGVVGNPKYVSEIIKQFIIQGKERYPELFTYQADWLAHIDEFGLNPSYTVSYTGQSIYAPNTLERPVKSASLKGQTLVNLFDRNSMTTEGLKYTFDNGVYTINTSKTWCKMIFTPNLVQNRKYLVMLSTSINDVLIYYRNSTNDATKICSVGQFPFIFTNPIDNLANVSIEFPSIVTNGTISQPMFIEYQDGMENWDISYFEGMQSVQLPRLTTTGKNLFNPSWKKDPNKVYPFKLKKGTTLTLSTKDSIPSKGGNLLFTTVSGREKWFSINKGATKSKTTLDEDVYQLKNMLEGTIEYQLEIGSVATTYEPYQSNILTSPKDLEMRGIGGVKDELNLKTGELTQRIGEVVLDGSEDWSATGGNFRLNIPNVKGYKDLKWGQKSAMCNLYPSFAGEETDCYIISEWDGNQIRIHDINTTLEELKTKLAKNPLHVIFILNDESVKTLELTVTDQNGQNVKQLMSFKGGTHFNTRSSEGSLLPTVSVSVETDLEETLKMCSLDGNTM